MNQSINFLLKLERITSATEQNERDSNDNDITDNITALETCEYESVWHFINEEKSTDTIEFWCNELPWRSLSASIIYIIINGWAWTASGSMLLIFFYKPEGIISQRRAVALSPLQANGWLLVVTLATSFVQPRYSTPSCVYGNEQLELAATMSAEHDITELYEMTTKVKKVKEHIGGVLISLS